MRETKYKLFLASIVSVHIVFVLDIYGQDVPQHFFSDSTEYIRTMCAQSINDTVFLTEISITDSVLAYLVDEIFQKEENCPYFSKCSSVSVRIWGVKDSLKVVNGEYGVHLSLWTTEEQLFGRPAYYFKSNGQYGFVNGGKEVIDSVFADFFRATGKVSYFLYDKKDVRKYIMEDDSHSLYEYWYMNKKWYHGESMHCND